MIKHIVTWKVRGGDEAARARNIAVLKAEFASLRGCVPGLPHLEVGVADSRIDHACDVVLYTEFASREALAADAEPPGHLRVRRALGDMRTPRHQVDYEAAAEAAAARASAPEPAGSSDAGKTHPGDSPHVQTV